MEVVTGANGLVSCYHPRMDRPDRPPYEKLILVCCNQRDPGEAACANRGSVELHKAMKDFVKSRGLQNRVRVTRSLCLGLCEKGPNVCIMPDQIWYHGVKPGDVPAILERHVTPMERTS